MNYKERRQPVILQLRLCILDGGTALAIAQPTKHFDKINGTN